MTQESAQSCAFDRVAVSSFLMGLDSLSDEELVERARREPGRESETADAALAVLYRRFYPKVAAWCLRLSGDRQEAADLAQEVFLRVHERLALFRGESRFSTWLYTVTRSVVINRGQAARRRQMDALDEEGAMEPVEPAPGADREMERGEIAEELRRAMGAGSRASGGEGALSPLRGRDLSAGADEDVRAGQQIGRQGLGGERRAQAQTPLRTLAGPPIILRRLCVMNGQRLHLTLEEWLHDAYAGCPGRVVPGGGGGSSRCGGRRRRLEEHADGCPACAAERDLARLFEAGEDGGPSRGRGLRGRPAGGGIAGQAGCGGAPAGAEGRAVPVPRSSAGGLVTRLAAAAMVVLAAGLFLQRFTAAPPLPAPPVRAAWCAVGRWRLLAPLGDVAAAPVELRWEPRPGAVSYKVRLWRWTIRCSGRRPSRRPPARLPAEVAQSLQPAVSYVWSVEALDAQGARLGGSEPARFRVRPL